MAKKSEESNIKFSLNEKKLESLFSYYFRHRDKFKTIKTMEGYELHYSSNTIDGELNDLINSFKTEFDLLHFKAIHINDKEKTVDITFDVHYRCDPDIAKSLIYKFQKGLA